MTWGNLHVRTEKGYAACNFIKRQYDGLKLSLCIESGEGPKVIILSKITNSSHNRMSYLTHVFFS